MKKLIPGRPSPAMIVAVVALVLALAGGAYAAATIGLGDLTKKAKNKTVGVGKLTYVTANHNVATTPVDETTLITADCPSGLKPIGGGVKKAGENDDDYWAQDGYPTATGWAAHIEQNDGDSQNLQVVVACALSRVVTGSPPAP